jgi:hypothetical protein
MTLQSKFMSGLVSSLLALSAATLAAQAPATTPASTTAPTTAAPAQTPAATPGDSTGAAQVFSGGTRVHGTITDPDGELIPGATVQFTPVHGAGIKAVTGSDGTYSLTVAPGTYTYVVSMKGFSSYSMLNLKVPAVASTTVDAKLTIGEQNTVINVEANALTLSVDPDSNQSATIISGKDLEALSDDPDELQSELQALAGPSAGPNGGQIYVDGFTGGQLPPKSSIREIRINQNPFSAQYDKLGYGRIEVFTKPGTDKLHGNIQLNGNPSQFNSGNPLTTTYQPPYHTFFMFGNLTGPLNKNASYNLGGTFRQIQDDNFTNATIFAAPGTTTICAPGSGAACAAATYQTNTYFPQTRIDINPRIDLALGQKNVLTTRYQFVKNDSTNSGVGNLTLPASAFDSSSLSNILQLSDTMTLSTRLINEIHFEYEREHVAYHPVNNNTSPSVSVSGAFNTGGYSGQTTTDHQDHFEIQNYTSLALKKNFIRFGGRLRTTREAEDTEGNTNGSFIYSSLTYTCTNTYVINGVTYPCTTSTSGQGTAADNSYATGTPRQFGITVVNNHKIGDTFADLGVYLETDWKPIPNLSVSYGFRYETQNHLGDHHDIAPRISFNYGLFAKHGAPKTVLRGGFGLFYDRFGQGNILTLQAENGINETVYTVKNPAATCVPTAANFITACGASPSAQTLYSAASALRTPYIVEFAGGADQQVSRFGTISINYLHSQGTHQLATQNLGYNFASPQASTASYQYFSEGVFNQNQLIVNGRVQTSKRISLFGYYTFNSAHGDTSGAGAFLTTPGNLAADYGRTTFDVRNRILLAGSISLPKFIQLSPFMIGQSGNPYNITTGSDNNNDTIFNDRPVFGPANGIAAGQSGTNTIAGCGSFVQPPTTGSYTTIPINYCTGPTLFTLNLRATKTFGFGASTAAAAAQPGAGQQQPGQPHQRGSGSGGGRGSGGGMFGGGGSSTGKRYNLTVGFQVQNLFNNEDLATPIGTLSSPEFGQSTQLVGGGGGGFGGAYTTNSALRRLTLQTSFSF